MGYVICPNCRTKSPAWTNCANCSAPLRRHNGHAPKSVVKNHHLTATQAMSKGRAVVMDPEWCRREQNNKYDIAYPQIACSDEHEVAVIARVTDLNKFKKLPQVKVKTAIRLHDKTTIVTARMPNSEEELQKVHDEKFVLSLKPGVRLRQHLEQTRDASIALPAPVPKKTYLPIKDERSPKPVIVGFVDFGLDFMHRNFRYADGSTRILALWDQAADPNTVPHITLDEDEQEQAQEIYDFGKASALWEKYGYGLLHTKPEIDKAIQVADAELHATDGDNKTIDEYLESAYRALRYAPPKDSLFQIGAHGTYVADVAVGNGLGTGAAGIAPEADIVFVEVATLRVEDHIRPTELAVSTTDRLGNSFGDSAQLLEAVKFIFDFAKLKDRPCVVNISLGTNGGPHDGSNLVELALDALVCEQPNRAIVIAAGNTHGKALHVRGQIEQGDCIDLNWQIPQDDPTLNKLELWYAEPDKLTVEVINPQGVNLGRITPGWQKLLLADPDPKGQSSNKSSKTDPNGKVKVSVINRQNDPNNQANTINIALDPGATPGIWKARLHGTSVKNGEFHAWIERDETGQSRFAEPDDDEYEITDECTLNTIACGKHTIVVGSYDATKHAPPSSVNSSAGPTRDGRRKPDLSAPGESVFAAYSRTLVLRNRVSGTSLAAPVVTGTIALMLAEAQKQRISLTAKQILKILKRTVQPEADGRRGWDPRKGYGRVSVKDAVEAIKPKKAGGAASASGT